MNSFDILKNWYGKFERPISSLSLVLGFVFDALTLKRVDTLWENIWILAHLVLVGVFITLIHTHTSEKGNEADPHKPQFWYVNALQFVFGGILSSYLVLYFRSVDVFVTWPFIALLVLAFWANESLKRHYVRFRFQISLFFLSVYSFAIFVVPVLMHRIGVDVFLISGLLSLVVILVFILVLFYYVKNIRAESKRRLVFVVLIIFGTINLLYFTNLIPPIPLSLKDGNVYHSIERDAGDYVVETEKPNWKDYFTLYHPIKIVSGNFVYAYSAIFSPTDLDITIYHYWQHYDDKTGQWVNEGNVALPVIGGRDSGFRTYSYRGDLQSGKWRVNIETSTGHLIGRLRFTIFPVNIQPNLVKEIKK